MSRPQYVWYEKFNGQKSYQIYFNVMLLYEKSIRFFSQTVLMEKKNNDDIISF